MDIFATGNAGVRGNRVVVTFGTFDVFHVGHLRLLRRAASLGDRLLVGVSTDALNHSKKGRAAVYSQDERAEIVAGIRCVDGVFFEESLEAKAQYLRDLNASVLVMGDDWLGRFDHLRHLCEVVYLPRTPAISTTATIERMRTSALAAVELIESTTATVVAQEVPT